MTRSLAAILTLAGILSASEAHAQHIFRKGHSRGPVVAATPMQGGHHGMMAPVATSTAHSPGVSASGGSTGDDFPFYGRPYGHAYAPWTFSTLSGSYGQSLARYYDPPVK